MARMDNDLLVRGGEVVDGTGAPAYRADVRVRAGRIIEVGEDLAPDGERVVDADGAYVAPGLIESHTHYDAAVWWIPTAIRCPRTAAPRWSWRTAASGSRRCAPPTATASSTSSRSSRTSRRRRFAWQC